jgi:hypothetical protein
MRGLMKTDLMPLMRTRAGVFAATQAAVVLMVPTGTPGAPGTRTH